MLEKIKSLLFKKKAAAKPDEAEIKRRARLNAELNHPDDNFENDEFLEEEEMRLLNEKRDRKGTIRSWYYVFGFIFAGILIVSAIVNIFKDSKFDMKIMVQDDGFITESEKEYIKEYITPFVPDKNEDGKVLVDVVAISLPSQLTDANEGIYQVALEEMSEELVPYYISIVVGRENFLKEVNDIRPLKEQAPLGELNGFEIEQGSALEEFFIAVRSTEKKGDKYSPIGIEIFNELVK